MKRRACLSLSKPFFILTPFLSSPSNRLAVVVTMSSKRSEKIIKTKEFIMSMPNVGNFVVFCIDAYVNCPHECLYNSLKYEDERF